MGQRHTKVYVETGWSWLSKLETMPDAAIIRRKAIAAKKFDASFSALQFLWDAGIDPFKEAI